jgi:hypothetical protein
MRAPIAIAVLVVGLVPTARAQQEFVPRIEFDCAGSAVTIDVRKRGSSATREGLVSVVLTVIREDADSREAAARTWEHIDFIGGTCISDIGGNPKIVYQTYCSGSGCNDQSNWGIFDAISLREILTPSEQNSARAQEILGVELPRLSPRINVSLAKQALDADQ